MGGFRGWGGDGRGGGGKNVLQASAVTCKQGVSESGDGGESETVARGGGSLEGKGEGQDGQGGGGDEREGRSGHGKGREQKS
jgi:hypothetical protein